MNLKKICTTSVFTVLTFSTATDAALGPIPIYLNPTNVSSNYFNDVDTNATFASEIYTEDEIKNSISSNLYDFLNQNTSISVAPASGNRFTQKIDIRGYGLTDGYQNIVITLNGRRLNNIDTLLQDLSVININDVEKIEITKGSGSVIYGDSAMAGAIHIYTKKSMPAQATVTIGSYGFNQTSISAGHNQEYLNLHMSIDNLIQGGFGTSDPKGNKDKGKQTNKKVGIVFYPNKETEIMIDYTRSNLDTRYPNYLTLSQFNENPSQNSSGRVYTRQETNYNIHNFKVKSQISENLELSLNTSKETKDSTNSYYKWGDITNYDTPTKNNYEYKTGDLLFTYKKDNLKIDGGITSFNGSRKGSSDTTTKENHGVFSQVTYNKNDTTYTIGARKELVDYAYKPNSGSNKFGEHNLNAFDIGINKRLNDSTSVFSNYNHAFQAPLIDRFFKWDGSFNGFMNPAKSKTLNIGISHLTDKSKTKATLFRSNLTNEMYYYSSGYKNTNLDKSHKQGLELQHRYIANSNLSTNINYAYTIAKIDEENESSGAYNGKDLPMTSKHNITASVVYKINDKSNITLTQKYRSKAFSEEDFENSLSQKQKEYNSTNMNLSYKHNNDLKFTLDIDNIFKNSYGTWLRNNVIYPSNFTRNISAGISYDF
jgi:iron complex outermembrane receptor protein